jgi:DNA polymerase I-like protein with 3'-5' exonuclease and polymerase domains
VFDISSPQQLMEVLYEKLKLPMQMKKGKPTSDKDALERLKPHHPMIGLLQEYRSVDKLSGSYVKGTKERYDQSTGKIHTDFLIHGTVTGRLASQDPNVQNLPRPENGGILIKSMFIAAPGTKWIMSDYSQIELRVAAHCSKEQAWIQAFKDRKDLHSATAKTCFNLECSVDEVKKLHEPIRTKAKQVNFGILYGMSIYGLAEELKCTPKEAEEFLKVYFGGLPNLAKWIEETHAGAVATGYVVNPFGRRRRLPEVQLWVPERQWKPQGAPACWGKRDDVPPILKQFYPNLDLKNSLEIFNPSVMLPMVQQIRNRTFEKCHGCNYIGSCVLSAEQARRDHQVQEKKRQAVNAIVQSAAADIAGMAFTAVIREAARHGIPLVLAMDQKGIAPVNIIHDELVFEVANEHVDQAAKLIKDVMINICPELLVPLDVDQDIVERWSDKYDKH